ncbi:hypothetical protein BGP77_12145 [Saccharospirillum sp. MSK14-1]|uniref:DUF1697 domain-containing protein n=1 Tax=Saccharospirillum sp. MSK14-1 TaxID=1897632 RepID=UPI000D37AA0A|nr:DUF1697 domain-containing protein [Saccharospirillum sp. MSK14-1]PTY38454.1 hypothetical protein BGP77_12145 [Saccharospirillum sp. MSK14-1]
MQTWIAFFRGINVGGRNSLPMKQLKALLTELGAQNIRTYIQSGNAVFEHPAGDATDLAEQIGLAVQQAHGFKPEILLLTQTELEAAIAANPYPQAKDEPKSVQLFFLATPAVDPRLNELAELKSNSEDFTLIDQVFYLFAPDGIGRSKLAERVERKLGVATTARNWRTVTKVVELLG